MAHKEHFYPDGWTRQEIDGEEGELRLPAWNECKPDAQLIAYALMRVTKELERVAEALEGSGRTLISIDKALDYIGNELPIAGTGR